MKSDLIYWDEDGILRHPCANPQCDCGGTGLVDIAYMFSCSAFCVCMDSDIPDYSELGTGD